MNSWRTTGNGKRVRLSSVYSIQDHMQNTCLIYLFKHFIWVLFVFLVLHLSTVSISHRHTISMSGYCSACTSSFKFSSFSLSPTKRPIFQGYFEFDLKSLWRYCNVVSNKFKWNVSFIKHYYHVNWQCLLQCSVLWYIYM